MDRLLGFDRVSRGQRDVNVNMNVNVNVEISTERGRLKFLG